MTRPETESLTNEYATWSSSSSSSSVICTTSQLNGLWSVEQVVWVISKVLSLSLNGLKSSQVLVFNGIDVAYSYSTYRPNVTATRLDSKLAHNKS